MIFSRFYCVQVLLVDAKGNRLIREGKIIGSDPAYDLAVLKVSAQPFIFSIILDLSAWNNLLCHFFFPLMALIAVPFI